MDMRQRRTLELIFPKSAWISGVGDGPAHVLFCTGGQGFLRGPILQMSARYPASIDGWPAHRE
jgi:hypothetical protein